MSKKYTVEVWDYSFYLEDEDGNPKKDAEGKVILYDAPHYDSSFMAEHLEVDDVVERESNEVDAAQAIDDMYLGMKD